MQIVINISKGRYEEILSGKPFIIYQNDIREVLKNGKPLPKGHGRLVDENELKKEAIRCEWSRSMYGTLDHTLSYMKPIIEADKES